MSSQLPFPSFEDIRRILNFWIDQQDKWFYFETAMLESGTMGRVLHFPPTLADTPSPFDDSQESTQYAQSRIVGKIGDVLPFPPSLLLDDASVFTVIVSFDGLTNRAVNVEERKKYGLVFSQIAYYEPIPDIALFLEEDPRVRRKIRKGEKR